MLLFTQNTSNRLLYILQFVESILGQAIVVTTNKENFINSNDAFKINYTHIIFAEPIYQIKPHSLLFETNIHQVSVDVNECRGELCFFKNDNDTHGFDVFAASFYLISRYEEYLPHRKDEYGRYAYTNSLAYQYKFLQKPLVNFWLQDLQQQLQLFYPNFAIKENNFQFIPTYDIDIAFAHQYQSITKKIYRFFKTFLSGNIDSFIEQSKLLTNKIADPFNVYLWLHQLHKTHCLKPIYFYLLATKAATYDKNIHPSVRGFQQFLKHQSAQNTLGIHPSWQSGDSEKKLKEELNWFQKILGKKALYSRQHYIRFSLPKTYETLILQGIEKDFSMGYGSINGFRASVTSPFFWFNVEKNMVTNLQIIPFCFMDANAFFEEELTVQEAAEELQQYYYVVKKVNGTLVTIFHNHFLTEQPQWIEWRKMYEDFIRKNMA